MVRMKWAFAAVLLVSICLVKRKRLTNCTVDRVGGFRRLVPGGPSAGREFGDSIDRKISQAREHETCRRLKIPIRDYLGLVLPGLADRQINRVGELTPAAWANANRLSAPSAAYLVGRVR
jgi:hypothetical protein